MLANRLPVLVAVNVIVLSSGKIRVRSLPSTHVTVLELKGLDVRGSPVFGSQKKRYEFELIPRTCATS